MPIKHFPPKILLNKLFFSSKKRRNFPFYSVYLNKNLPNFSYIPNFFGFLIKKSAKLRHL